jgi:hypothetical protein
VLLYFMKGSLPWQGATATTKEERYARIGEIKGDLSPATLFRGFPPEFTQILQYCRGLKYEEKPDYDYIRRMLHAVAEQEGFTFDNHFDWILPPSLSDVYPTPVKKPTELKAKSFVDHPRATKP